MNAISKATLESIKKNPPKECVECLLLNGKHECYKKEATA